VNIRLKIEEIKNIKSVIYEFDKNAKIYLFGSRVDLHKRGGDIDILVISNEISVNQRRSIKIKLYNTLGERKIDLIITKKINTPFLEMATKTGICL
jgi:predicted nucleotidyltransferase